MQPLPPIFTIDLFPELDHLLIEILKSLSAKDWERPTLAPLWKVRDIAAHLLDGNIRSLSMLRDQYSGETPGDINSYQDLVAYLNRLNADWVKAMKRVSPVVITELLALTGKAYYAYLTTLPPFEKAAFSVAWAGEDQSDNWFHIAREYTEKWHHQQQIRLAVGQEAPLYRKKFYFPYLDTSLRALPYHYREVPANPGEVIAFTVTGEGGGTWHLYADGDKWQLVTGCQLPPVCEVILEGEIAWRIFTKGISKEAAEQRSSIQGRQAAGRKIFDLLAVMA